MSRPDKIISTLSSSPSIAHHPNTENILKVVTKIVVIKITDQHIIMKIKKMGNNLQQMGSNIQTMLEMIK